MGNVHYTLVDEVCAKNSKIDHTKLREILEQINAAYTVAKKKKRKVDFRALWAPTIARAGIDDMFLYEDYTKAIAHYYHLRRKDTAKKLNVLARDMTVMNITIQSARVQVTPTFAIIFRTHNAYGKLKASDLSVDFTSTAAGATKPILTKATQLCARNKAITAINNLRKRVQKPKRSRR